MMKVPTVRSIILGTLQSPKVSGTQNGDTVPYNAVLGVEFPLPKPYIPLSYVKTSMFGTSFFDDSKDSIIPGAN